MKNFKRLLALLLIIPCIFLFGCKRNTPEDPEENKTEEINPNNPNGGDDDGSGGDDDTTGGDDDGDVSTSYYYIYIDYSMPSGYEGLIDNIEVSLKEGNNYTFPEIRDELLSGYFLGYYETGESELHLAGDTYSGEAGTTTTFCASWSTGLSTYLSSTYCTSGLEFEISSVSAVVTNYSGTSSFVVIPKTYTEDETEYSVTDIGEAAFKDNTTVTDVVINANSVTIGKSAFYNSTIENLSYVAISEIGESAFYGCTNLESVAGSVNGNPSLTSIGAYAFYGCENLDGLNLSNAGFSYIYAYTFYGCKAFTSSSISLPNGVVQIKEYAFAECSKLLDISFINNCNSLVTLDNYAFSGCTGLIEATLYANITSIGYGIFNGCTNLSSLTLYRLYVLNSTSKFSTYYGDLSGLKTLTLTGSYITKIQSYYFDGVSSLVNLDMSGSAITEIASNAFNACKNITTISFPSTLEADGFDISIFENTIWYTTCTEPLIIGTTLFLVPSTSAELDLSSYQFTTVGSKAFYGDKTLKKIIFPSLLVSILDYAFYECSNLETVVFGENSGLESIGTLAFYDCGSLSSVDFENLISLKSIGEKAFCYCSSLDKLTITSSLVSIGNMALYGTSLSEITISNTSNYFKLSGGGNILYEISGSNLKLLYYLVSATAEVLYLDESVIEVLGGAIINNHLKYIYVSENTSVTFNSSSKSSEIGILSESSSVSGNGATNLYYELNGKYYTIETDEEGNVTIALSSGSEDGDEGDEGSEEIDLSEAIGTWFIKYKSGDDEGNETTTIYVVKIQQNSAYNSEKGEDEYYYELTVLYNF